MRTLVLLTLLVCVGAIATDRASAQSFSQGREYYLTFPQNLHQGTGPLDLTVFIASHDSTGGTVALLTSTGVRWSTRFSVGRDGVAEIMIPHAYDNFAEIQDAENETVVRKAIHIVADAPVMVYGLNHWPFTSDGYMAIPPYAWGTDNIVAAYYGITRADEFPGIRATSQFAVVAAYNDTRVTIQLTDATMDAAGRKTHDKGGLVQVMMNAGDVYQMQALKVAGQANDLTGTHITSSKPVGLLAGAKCTDVPMTKPACDHLVDWIPPTRTWGTEYVTFPLDLTRTGGDTWRVIPQTDSTVVSINNMMVATISASDPLTPFFETDNYTRPELRTAARWTFSKPVLMCQYINGQTLDNSDHGDPSMVVLESVNQYQRDVVCAVPADSNGYANDLTIVVNDSLNGATGYRDSVLLDGYLINQLPSPAYTLQRSAQAPRTNCWVHYVRVPGGAHHLVVPSALSAIAVGFKNYESYAWPCSMGLKTDAATHPPALFADQPMQCNTYQNSIWENLNDPVHVGLGPLGTNRTGIGWLHGKGIDSTYNMDPMIVSDTSTYVPGSDRLDFVAHATDPTRDAHGALFAFTLAAKDTTFYLDYHADRVEMSPAILDMGSISDASVTRPIVITNTTSHTVIIKKIELTDAGKPFALQQPPYVPDTLKPNEVLQVTVKFNPWSAGHYQDTLFLSFPCYRAAYGIVRGDIVAGIVDAASQPAHARLLGIAPNPVERGGSGMLNIDYEAGSRMETSFSIVNMLGVEIESARAFDEPGMHTRALSTAHLAPGAYALRFRAGQTTTSALFVVMH